MIIDGNKIASRILEKVRADVEALDRKPSVRIVVVGNDPATKMFVLLKQRRAHKVGIEFNVERFPESTSTEEIINSIESSTECSIVVQLPLPAHINTSAVLDAVPKGKDADVLSANAYEEFASGSEGALKPPVVGAVQEVLLDSDFNVHGKHAVIVGDGLLVGKPVSKWFENEGAIVDVVTLEKGDLKNSLSSCEIVVSGAGVPNLIKSDFVKNNCVLIDAGTSEYSGAIVGDIDPACAEKSLIYTPVPGGIGPITVAVLLQNIVEIAKRRFA